MSSREAWEHGVAAASAALVGVVAARLGSADPVVDAMVRRVGQLVTDGPAEL